MAKELNATCKICGKKYHMCRTCSNNKGTWASWMQHTDTKDCFEIFTILYDRRINAITDAEAKEKLQKCDLTGIETFDDGMKALIKEILESKVTKTKEVKDTKEVKEVEETESLAGMADKPDESKKTKKKFSL